MLIEFDTRSSLFKFIRSPLIFLLDLKKVNCNFSAPPLQVNCIFVHKLKRQLTTKSTFLPLLKRDQAEDESITRYCFE